jgi:hypothetical protein
MAITKLSLYDSRPERTGSSLIHPVNRLYSTGSLDKTASTLVPELVDYLEGLPDPSHDEARAVITALSAYDTFGPNKNGDAFFREDLTRMWDYGQGVGEIPMYESFEHYARPYKHHINRPDSQAYGKVLKAFWNPGMDRVELVVSVDRRLAKDIVERIEGYGDVSTSMGFRAKYDVCLYCGNRASRRPDYCEHARRQMLQVMPNGQIIAVRNPEGKFFDISFVIDPADITSRAVWVNRLGEFGGDPVKTATLKETLSIAGEGYEKLAQIAVTEGGPLDVYLSSDLACANGICEIIEKKAEDKSAAENKEADIDKEVSGTSETVLSPTDERLAVDAVRALRASEPDMEQEFMDQLLQEHSLEEILAGLFMAGVSPSPREAQYLALCSEGMPKSAARLWKSNIVLDTEGVDPIEFPVSAETDGVDKVASTCLEKEGFMEARSLHGAWLPNRLTKIAFGSNPFLQHEEVMMRPQMAGAIMDRRELQRYEADKKRSGLRYVLGLLTGARWAIRKRQVEQMIKRNPAMVAEMMLGRGALPEDLAAADHLEMSALMQNALGHTNSMQRRPMPQMMMTAPISHYARGVNKYDMYPSMGLLESALSKEASMRKKAQSEWNALFSSIDASFSTLAKTAQKLPVDESTIEVWGAEYAPLLVLAQIASKNV